MPTEKSVEMGDLLDPNSVSEPVQFEGDAIVIDGEAEKKYIFQNANAFEEAKEEVKDTGVQSVQKKMVKRKAPVVGEDVMFVKRKKVRSFLTPNHLEVVD